MAYTPTDNPYIPGDPYSYDLKWIVAKIKEALSSIEGLTTGQSDLSNDFEELREYVYNYFDNLDISQEVEDKINELYAAGFFDDIIEEWMNGHIKWTNPNLLDNPWFTVNQRGFTTGDVTGGDYTADRWKYSGSMNISISANGVTLTNAVSAGWRFFVQRIDKDFSDHFTGETFTLSVMTTDGTIFSDSFTIPQRSSSDITVKSIPLGINQARCEYHRSSTLDVVQFALSGASTSISFKAVKLEKGPYTTLSNDTAPNYPEELAKCKYYFERVSNNGSSNVNLGLGYADTTDRFYPTVNITPKRITPSISNSVVLMAGQRSTNINLTGATVYSYASNGSMVLTCTSSTAFTIGELYKVTLPGNSYIDFSADL